MNYKSINFLNFLNFLIISAIIFVVSFKWKTIGIPLSNHNEIISNITLKNYNPINDTIRYVIFISLPLISFILFNYFFNSKNVIAISDILKKNSYDNENLNIENYFDMEKWASYFAVVDILGAYHGSLSKSIRLYFNPTSSKFEPIGYDAHLGAGNFSDFILADLLQENKPNCIYICDEKDWYFKFFKLNQNKFDLIMIKQTLHFFNEEKKLKLIKACKNNLNKNGVLLIFSLNTLNNEIPCFKVMKQKLNRGLKRDSRMLNSVCKILKDNKIDKFKFKVLITKNKYIQMLKQKYISCLINLNKAQISKGINEIKNTYPNMILFEDILICIKYKHS